MRQEIYDIQTKLRWEEFMSVIQHLTDIIRNQQRKYHDLLTTLSWVDLNYANEREGLTLYLDQQLKWHTTVWDKEEIDETTRVQKIVD